jgi:hypothetical protein
LKAGDACEAGVASVEAGAGAAPNRGFAPPPEEPGALAADSAGLSVLTAPKGDPVLRPEGVALNMGFAAPADLNNPPVDCGCEVAPGVVDVDFDVKEPKAGF